MKKIISILIPLLLFLNVTLKSMPDVDCTIEIQQDQEYIDGTNFVPGDVVCLLSSNKDYLLFKNIQGTAEQPITIINKGGPIVIDTDHFYGIKFDNCKHIIFSGTGTEGVDYGFQIKRVGNGAGMSIDNRSTNFEVENIEVSFTSIAGIYAKTEPYQGDCDNLITRDNFTMYDLSIHDCYLHDIADEGFYIGSSKYTGQTVYPCDDIVVLPHVIIGVEIYNNIIENTGWDGIQVSSSPENCSIYNNIIKYDSYEEMQGQMSGILIGGGSACDCYNNKIFDGKGDGIDVLGLGNMKVYNNLIVRAGRTYLPNQPDQYKHGIWVGDVVTTPGANFEIYNNTIVSPKSSGIKYTNAEANMGYIKNNIITDPGQLDYNPDVAYLNIPSNITVDISNNFNVADNIIPKFINYNDDDFDLEPNSAAVNYGTSLTSEGVTFDILNRARPFHTYFDAGAYECHDPYADIDDYKEYIGEPYPIPARNNIKIPIGKHQSEDITISLISMQGIVLIKEYFLPNLLSDNEVTINTAKIQNGTYVLSIKSDNYSINKSIIILK